MGIASGLVGLISKMAKQTKLFPSGSKALTFIRKEGLSIRTQTFYKQWRHASNLILGEKRLSALSPTKLLRRSQIPTAGKKLLNNYLVFADVSFYDRTLNTYITRTVSLYANRLKRIDSFMSDVKEMFVLNADNYNTTSDDITSVSFRSAIRSD